MEINRREPQESYKQLAGTSIMAVEASNSDSLIHNHSWSNLINKKSQDALDTLASWGESYDSATSNRNSIGYHSLQYAGNTLSALSAAEDGTLLSSARQIAEKLKKYGLSFNDHNSNSLTKQIQRFQSAKYAQGVFGKIASYGAKGASVFGGALSAASGVGEVLSTFSKERKSGAKDYAKTLKTSLKAVAQSSWGYAAASASAAAAASVLGAGLAPLAIGAAAGAAGAWALGRLLR